MSQPFDVAVLVGSLRADSLNRRVADALSGLAPPSIALSQVAIGDLPLYNPDLDTDAPPAAWTRFRERVARADALLFVTPEYNRSVPAALKNALDVGSRPYGKSVFGGKPGAVVSVSPGAIGGFGANHHLRQSLVFLDVPLMQQPEAYLGGADKFFGEDGKLANESTGKFLGKIIHAYADWVARIKA
jgi:chromate reductase